MPPKMIRRTYSIEEDQLPEAIKKASVRKKSLSRLIRDYLVNLPLYPVSKKGE